MPRLTRRQLGPALVGALAAPAALAAQDEKKPKEPREVAADALLEIVKLRYGKQLDEAKLKAVRGGLVSNLATAERLRKAAADDEPAFAFSAELP